MIRLLPFILIPVILVAGLWYWRNSAEKQSLTASQDNEATASIEVPKTLPGASLADRIQSLEDTVTKLAQSNSQKSSGSSGSQAVSSADLESRLKTAEATVTELKARISALEKATPVPAAASSNKYPLYIPLGSSGGPWTDQDWTTLAEYQASINPDNYSGYSSMQLEVNFRLTEAAGTGSVRLYNVTDGSSVSSQVDTTSTSYGLQTSSTFKLSGGQKTYTIQVKNSQGKQLFVQSARIKVNF